jgi:lipoprotein-releasing system permease protein
MNGFKVKFHSNILKISPHVTMRDEELARPASLLSDWAGGEPVVANVAHQTPSERQLAIKRPTEIVEAIQRMSGVRAASACVSGTALVTHGGKQLPVDVRGIDPQLQDRVTSISEYVLRGSYRDLSTSGNGVLLGMGVARRIGADVGDVVMMSAPAGANVPAKVVGVFDAGIPGIDNNRVYMMLTTSQVVLGRKDSVNRIEVKLDDTTRAPAVATELERTFGYDAESWQEQNANSLTILRQQDTIIGFVIAAILAVGGFGILAVQIMIVMQKTRDIAILRSVGFRRRDIMLAFLAQGALVSLVGGLLGDIIGHYLLRGLGTMRTPVEGLIRTEYFLVHDDPRMYAYGIAFALGVGLCASAIPAARASRVEPVDVLRGQLG